MRLSNWVAVGFAILLSVGLLWSWYVNGFSKVDGPLDVIATLIWWVVIVGVIVAITYAERERRRRIRTAFIASDSIYNAEVGIVSVPRDRSTLDTLTQVMDSLSYGDDLDDPAGRTLPPFTKIVRTGKFENSGDVWSGEVVFANSDERPVAFNSREELSELLIA